ncbi:hypothetical protein J671_0823 [Acinetobacter sp. 1130196]|nr:hypothetical protein ACINWC487_1812 [Acinetobacter nosocomialis]EXB10163.1 hypothetical protein J514_2977 [Acinetobacter sp. 1396970]EXE97866.1 hypothetical protein J594_3015 [Acinetobacter sp. 259052]EXH15797.1 hypothetical protein J627_1033 [Acinetobacter sp. 1245593]EXH76616.1 hypothetical protein J633_1873 [Acinetobacter sp. 216872]EXI13857.1 hypothetical protein J604_0426 [Acinetobacter sp. 694762]EXR19451.1 hypothetical protein J671_0823 [Acinetobacter sp. 1130196]EXR29434.1 hypothe
MYIFYTNKFETFSQYKKICQTENLFFIKTNKDSVFKHNKINIYQYFA